MEFSFLYLNRILFENIHIDSRTDLINNSILGLTTNTRMFLKTIVSPFSLTKVYPAFGIQLVTAAPRLIDLSVAISPTTLALPQLQPHHL